MKSIRKLLAVTFHKIKYLCRIIAKKEVAYSVEIILKKELIGNYQSEWCVASDYLNKDSIIYSFGVGTDISFDIGLIEKYGCSVYAFDPTPRSKEWIKQQTLSTKFKLFDYGIFDRDDTVIFYPPAKSNHVSFSTNLSICGREGITLPVYRLKTIMTRLGHINIDLLKMDIEGSEYCVIQDIINSDIVINQIMIEFHHRFEKLSLKKTADAIDALRSYGLKIFYVSPSGEEYSFIRSTIIKLA